jgi:hypothetical protein
MRLPPAWRLPLVVGTALVFWPALAWAPPLCSYGETVGTEILALRLRSATVDGVQMVLAPATTYQLQSGCLPDSLDGVLADPDAAGGKRTVFWGRSAP